MEEINININNLKEGQIIDNYKKLCKILEIKFQTNVEGRKSQLKELERFCMYFKEGRKYIINRIYKTPLPKENNRIGEINYNFYKSKMKIIEYTNSLNIIVEFENGYKIQSIYSNFKNGNIKNPYDKSVQNIGYLGEYDKKYNPLKNHNCYKTWVRMIQRCYSKIFQEDSPTYKDVHVCKDWHCFSNFSKWYEKNYYDVEGEKMALDKDILLKNSKIYSPETCIFVPQEINNLFVKSNSIRGKCPIGVTYDEKYNKYRCGYQRGKRNNSIYLGSFDTKKEAFNAYKITKENYIKEIADKYKNKIPNKLYKAMYDWNVEIDD